MADSAGVVIVQVRRAIEKAIEERLTGCFLLEVELGMLGGGIRSAKIKESRENPVALKGGR